MNTDRFSKGDNSWKDFLHFGEEILNLSSATAQAHFISHFFSKNYQYKAKLWLASPFYPLPGQEQIDTLPHVAAPACVKNSFIKKQSINQKSKKSRQACLTIPLLTQDSVLGVIELYKKNGDFSESEIDLLEGFSSSAALAMQISRQIVIKNWRSEQLSLISKVSREVANIHDLEIFLQKIVSLIQDEFNFYYVAILFLDEDRHLLTVKAESRQSRSKQANRSASFIIGDGIVGVAAATASEIVINDIKQDPRFQKNSGLPETRAEIALPLKMEKRMLGVLDIHSNQKNAFHDQDLITLRTLADNIAVAIVNLRLFSDLQNRTARLSAILDVNHTLSSILDFDELLQSIVDLIHEHFKYPFVHLFTVDSLISKVLYRAGSGIRSGLYNEEKVIFDLDAESGIIPFVARTGQSFLSGDVSRESLFRKVSSFPVATKSEMAIPLIYGANILGVLDIQSDLPYAFTAEDQTLIEGLASGIALSLRNASLYRSEKWRRSVADGFREVAGLLSANIELDELLEKILLEIEKNLPCEASAIWLLDNPSPRENLKNQELRLAALRGVDAEKISINNNDPRIKEWLVAALDCCDPRVRKISDPYGPLGIALKLPQDYSSIAVPLIAGNYVLGILTLVHRSPGRYGEEAIAMTTTHASYAAVAIQNAQLFSEAQTQAWISTVLLQVSESIQDINSTDELLENVARISPMLIGLSRCAFLLWNENESTLELKSSFGFNFGDRKLFIREADYPLLNRLRLENESVIISDPTKDLGFEGFIPRSSERIMALPLASRGVYLGAFIVVNDSDHSNSKVNGFDDQTQAILRGIANQTAVALENINLLEVRQEEAYVTAVLLQVAQAVTSQNELEDILATIIHLIPILVGIDTTILYRFDKEQNLFRPVQAYAGNHSREMEILEKNIKADETPFFTKIMELDLPISIQIPGLDDLPLSWSTLTYPEEPFDPFQIHDRQYPILHAFPLSISGHSFGILLAMEPRLQAKFYEKRMEILSGIAQNIALAIQNDRLKLEMIERQRLNQEMDVARKIQITFLPESIPHIPNCETAVRWITARQVGGDFYDVIQLNEGRYGFVIADVSDKGIPAALYMTVTRTLIRAYAEQFTSPAKVLSQVNRLLQKDTPDGSYVTAVYCVLDPKSGDLTYANAGHNLPFWIHKTSGKIEELPGGNIAMGVLQEASYSDHHFKMRDGDALILITDGIVDEFNRSGDAYGNARLIEVIKRNKKNGIRKLIDDIEASIKVFTDGAIPSDDMTILGIKYCFSKEKG